MDGLPWWLSGKESACSAEDLGSIPGSGSSPEEEHGNALQHFCLGNSMDSPRGLKSMECAGRKELDMTEHARA